MRLIDLSQPIFDNCPHYPGDPPVRSQLLADHAKGGWRVEHLALTPHTGSHIDAPLHRFAVADSIDKLPLDRFTGPAFIADVRGARPGMPFTSSMLSRALHGKLEDSIVLVATGWGAKRSHSEEWLEQSPYVSPDGAEWLVEQGIRGVGIDHYSIGGCREPQNSMTHEILLGAGVWIVEELRFPEEVFALEQPVQFWALPIHLQGHSGAFCRPVLVVD